MEPGVDINRTKDVVLQALARVADAARDIPFEQQPRRLQDALTTLGITESRLISPVVNDGR